MAVADLPSTWRKPTDEMALRAIQAAELATFTNRGTLGRRQNSPVFGQNKHLVARDVQRDELENVIRRIRTAVNRMSPRQREEFFQRYAAQAALDR